MSAVQNNVVQGGLHLGGALQHLVSKYPTLLAVIKEQVQNSIDKKAKNITVRVDFDRREVEHLDNGEGADKTFSDKALGSIGQSTKKTDQYGRFGIGLVAPLSVCDRYTFTSTTYEQSYYLTWTFDRRKLFDSKDSFQFLHSTNRFIHHASKPASVRGSQQVWWTTQVMMRGLTEDKKKSELDLDNLSHEIQSEFSKKMLELGISVTVIVIREGEEKKTVIHGKAFQGKKLAAWSKISPSGKVTAQMYLAPPGATGPVRVLIGMATDLYRLPWSRFALTSGHKYLKEETRNALSSGIFQGEIVSEGVNLTATRRSFEDDDALLELGLALDDWYDQVGKDFLSDEKVKRARERYQGLGTEVISALSFMFKGVDAPFARIVDAATYGSVGKGHSAPPKGSVVPGYTMTGTTTPVKERGERTSSEVERPPAARPQPNHQPQVAIGPRGDERLVVKGHSKGPHILFNDFDGSSNLWNFDKDSLCLQINITHPSFVAVEKSDYKVKVLAEQIFLTAFQIELQDPDYRMHAEKFASEMLNGYVELLQKGTIARKVGSK